ncbi:MAG: hypothetical protein ACKOCV_05980 [Gemmatimonadota bacterium]
MRLVRPLALCLLALGTPSLLAAQVRGVSVTAPAAPTGARATTPAVPVHLLPPAGKCRVWMEEVPTAQQPAPTDCATALRLKPANAVVLYGPPLREEDDAFKRGAAAPARPAARSTDEAARARRAPAKAAAKSPSRPPAERRP